MQISFVNFKFFKPMNWRKRSTEARRRNCAGLPFLHAGCVKIDRLDGVVRTGEGEHGRIALRRAEAHPAQQTVDVAENHSKRSVSFLSSFGLTSNLFENVDVRVFLICNGFIHSKCPAAHHGLQPATL